MTLTLTAAEVQTLHTWLTAMGNSLDEAIPGVHEIDRRALARRIERAAAGVTPVFIVKTDASLHPDEWRIEVG